MPNNRKYPNKKYPNNRNYRKKESVFSPAIIVINIMIAVVLLLMVFFIYQYITSEESAPPKRTTPTSPTQTAVPDETIEDETFAEETTEPLVITKATTTTPAVSTEPDILPPGEYSKEFFSNDLFIGDSIMTGFSGFGFLPAGNVVAKVGLNPESVASYTDDNGVSIYKHAAEFNPTRVFIMLGTNGLSFMNGSYMSKKMGEFIAELEKSIPDSEIIILTIPPVTELHEETKPENMADINAYNDLLKKLASDNNWRIIDICEHLKDSTGHMAKIYAEQDGLHFLGTAYKAVLSFIQSELEE